MDSILIYQAANDLVQNTGTRNIKRIARSCSLDILETPRFKDSCNPKTRNEQARQTFITGFSVISV